MFLFEFMDAEWLPESLRTTVREVLEYCLGEPRQYYTWVVGEILQLVDRYHFETVMELGAGTAPLARRLAENSSGRHLNIEVSDIYPSREIFEHLEQQFPGVVKAHLDAMDISQPIAVRPNTLLVLSASFHHLPPSERRRVLNSLYDHSVAVFEPMAPNLFSMLVALGGLVAGFITPLRYFRDRSGRMRRFLWCWIIPAAPIIIVWDGLVSCLRCWSEQEWRRQFARATRGPKAFFIKSSDLSQMVSW